MQNMVKVWNDNHLPFVQDFRGDRIDIPAKGFVEMEYDDANSFLGKPFPMQFDGMGQPKPEGFKQLRIEGGPKFQDTQIAYKCHIDGSLHGSKEELEKYELQFKHRIAQDDDPRKKKT
jgi:hypothetical protein